MATTSLSNHNHMGAASSLTPNTVSLCVTALPGNICCPPWDIFQSFIWIYKLYKIMGFVRTFLYISIIYFGHIHPPFALVCPLPIPFFLYHFFYFYSLYILLTILFPVTPSHNPSFSPLHFSSELVGAPWVSSRPGTLSLCEARRLLSLSGQTRQPS